MALLLVSKMSVVVSDNAGDASSDASGKVDREELVGSMSVANRYS